jgi:hypothetical protein
MSRKATLVIVGVALVAFAILAAVVLWPVYLSYHYPIVRLPDDPDQLVVYSIDGAAFWRTDGKLTPELRKGELLHGYPILGKVDVSDAAQRRQIVAAMKNAVRSSTESPAACFIPRHAIRTTKGSDVIDVVICFQCHIYSMIYGQADGQTDAIRTISSSTQPLLDKLFSDAGVPLAPKDHPELIR